MAATERQQAGLRDQNHQGARSPEFDKITKEAFNKFYGKSKNRWQSCLFSHGKVH